jgi:hypothetical protein
MGDQVEVLQMAPTCPSELLITFLEAVIET